MNAEESAGFGPDNKSSQRAVVTASTIATSGRCSRLARCVCVSQPFATCSADGSTSGNAVIPAEWARATRSVERWPIGYTTASAGRSMPWGGNVVGGRCDSRPPPVKATAIGSDDSFVTSTMVNPPASATE